MASMCAGQRKRFFPTPKTATIGSASELDMVTWTNQIHRASALGRSSWWPTAPLQSHAAVTYEPCKMGSLTRMVLFACFMSLLAVTQGQPFVQVEVPGVQDRPNSDATAAIDVYSSGSELENGLAAIMFPISFFAVSTGNLRSCRVRLTAVEPAQASLDLNNYDFDVFATESTCTLSFPPYALQNTSSVTVEFEVGFLSQEEIASASTTALLGRGPFGGSCSLSASVVREFSEPVQISCTGFQSENGSPLLAYVTTEYFLDRSFLSSSLADDDDDDDDDDYLYGSADAVSSPLIGSSESYSVTSLSVTEFELVPISPSDKIDMSHVFVDIRDNGSIGLPADVRKLFFHFVDSVSGAHHRIELSVRVERISDKQRDTAIKDIFEESLEPFLTDLEAFRGLNASQKFAFTYQYYLVASSIRNRLFTDSGSVSKDQLTIMRALASFSEDLTTALIEDSPEFGTSPMILALEAVIMPFSEATRLSYDPSVYTGALRSVDRLLRNSTVGITTIPYNQAALVRVTSAAVEGLDQIKSSSSRSGTLLTAEVATMTRGLVSRIQDTVYPNLLCGAPAFFDRNNYITLLNQVNTVATFARTPLVLPSVQRRDTEFLMPAVAFTGIDTTDTGCLLYDLSGMSERLFPPVSSNECRLSVSTCTFREASGLFSEQAIQTPSDDPIMITFKVPDNCEPSGSNPCQFYLPGSNSWSSAGCKPVSNSGSELVCACTHLTDFTLLIDSTNGDNSSSNQQGFNGLYGWLSLGFILGAIVVVVVVAIVHDIYRIERRRRLLKTMYPRAISGDTDNSTTKSTPAAAA